MMDLGIALPTSGPLAAPGAIVQTAEAAERLGYAAVWTYERLLYALGDIDQGQGPPRPLPEVYKMVYEPIETLAYVAARTSRVKLGISVLDLPFHVPVMLARRLATLDQFSGGRVIAGVGQGWMDQEFQTANVSKKLRGKGVEEAMAALRAAWGPDPVTFEGQFYQIAPSEINPKPVQPGGIPILMGVFAPAAIARAGRVADGFNPIAFGLEPLTHMVGAFRAAAEAAGRDPANLPVMVRANVPITATPLPDAQRPFLGGTPEQIVGDLERLASLHLDQVFFSNTAPATLESYLDLWAQLHALATERGVLSLA
jgi:probable F420-dependent oxidoreductase